MNGCSDKYTEVNALLSDLGLTMGDLEEYSFYSIRKKYNIVNLSAATLMLVTFLFESFKVKTFDLYLIMLGPIIVYTCLSFISNLSIQCGYFYITPYRESNMEGGLEALSKNLIKYPKRTQDFLDSVVSYKSTRTSD